MDNFLRLRFPPRGGDLWLIGLFALLVLTAGGCGSRAGDEVAGDQVLVIGLDGATWDILHPLMADGKLPHISGLVQRGYASHLETVPPPSLSPIIWTTIATGRPKREHGIKHFLYADPKTGETLPYTSNMRQSKAFWNILSDHDRTVGVVGWWISWPAEEVDGIVVTSYSAVKVAKRLWKGTIYPNLENQTYPPEFMDEVRPIIEDCEETVNSELNRRIFGRVDEDRLNSMQEMVVEDTRNVFLSDEIYARTTEKILAERDDLDVVAVYLSGTDVASHRFWKYYQPDGTPTFKTSAEEVEMLGDVIPDYYEYVDEVIGRLLAAAPDRNVILISDHGFHAELQPRRPGQPAMHQDVRSGGHETKDLPGIVVLSGPAFVSQDLTGEPKRSWMPNIKDILPTLLYLVGLETARDMPGRVLKEAIDPDRLEASPVRSRETYEDGRPNTAPVPGKKTDADEAHKERLKSLGYLDEIWDGQEEEESEGEEKGGGVEN